MKKLLVIPIMVVYFLWAIIVLSIWGTLKLALKLIEYISDSIDMIANLVDEYLFMPAKKIYLYALRIMKSDKTIKWMKEASEKLKRGEPITNSKDLREL